MSNKQYEIDYIIYNSDGINIIFKNESNKFKIDFDDVKLNKHINKELNESTYNNLFTITNNVNYDINNSHC